MYDCDNDIRILEFYKKLPPNDKRDASVFITAEKIYELDYIHDEALEEFNIKLQYVLNLKSQEIKELIEKGYWNNLIFFKRLVASIKEYFMLRPNIIEEYPELLI